MSTELQRIAELEAENHALRNETAEEREAREKRSAHERRVAEAREHFIRTARIEIARVERDRAPFEQEIATRRKGIREFRRRLSEIGLEPTVSWEQSAWKRKRDDIEFALAQLERGGAEARFNGWESISLEEWALQAGFTLKPGRQTVVSGWLSLKTLGHLVTEFDKRLDRLDMQAANYGLTLDDLRRA